MLLLNLADPRLGVVSLFLVAGAGVDVLVSTMVFSLVSPTAQIVGTSVCEQGNISKAVTQTCASLASTLPAILNGGNI